MADYSGTQNEYINTSYIDVCCYVYTTWHKNHSNHSIYIIIQGFARAKKYIATQGKH